MFRFCESFNRCFLYSVSSLIKTFLVETVSSSYDMKLSLSVFLNFALISGLCFLYKKRAFGDNVTQSRREGAGANCPTATNSKGPPNTQYFKVWAAS